VAATYNGSPFDGSDPNLDVFAIPTKVAGAQTVLWNVFPVSPAKDLSAYQGTFTITLKTDVNPREVDGFGAGMSYTRSSLGGGEYQVVITGQPVSVTSQEGCTFPAGGPTCTPVSPKDNTWILQGEVSDYNYDAYNNLTNYPAGFVNSFDGMVMYTNIAETSLPPELMEVDGQNELVLGMTDHHFEHDGTTLVKGDFYLRIPAAFLSTYWGINDPTTLATDGLNASIGAGGGTLTVTVEPNNAAVDVTVSGMTFSRRKLKIKLGHVTPRAPTHIKASRTNGTTGKVTFTKSKARGQKVNGYQLSCKAMNGTTVTAKGKRSPLVVSKLVSGQAYTCTMRGHSKAGYGRPSSKFSIRR
jgi:Fibronectin type III domain